MTNSKVKPVYANAKNVVLSAIIDNLYSFKSKEDALEVMDSVREKFVLSKASPENERESLIIWIKDFEVSAEEKNFTGNFASIFVEQKKDKKWTLKAQKVPTELKHHPQRKYEKAQHPNWGHPLLRQIKKKRVYEVVEPLQNMLQTLQEDFPKTSVPAAGKLYIMIYEKAQDKPKGGAVNRYVLEIKAGEDGVGFYIDSYPNEAPVKKAGAKKEGREEEKTAQGKFTTMVELGRAKKRPKKPPILTKPTE